MAISPSRRGDSAAVSDFDTTKLLADTQEHERNISDLTARLAELEKKVSTPQATAEFIKECAKDSRNFDNVFAEMFRRFLDENQEVKDAVQERMAKVDREFFFKTFKRFWGTVRAILLVVLGAIAKPALEWLLSLIPHVPK